jgi:hypothetical protein
MRLSALAGLLAALAAGAGLELVVTPLGGARARVTVRAAGAAAGGEVAVLRSTAWLDADADTVALPVTTLRFGAVAGETLALLDSFLADGTRYYYRAVCADGRASGPESLDTPPKPAPRAGAYSLLVDKLNYRLELRSGGRAVKRYPIALGREPRRRKLHQDNASTPEGDYRITGRNPRSRFHKALDIDYPNEADRARYRRARAQGRIRAGTGIGGEIQLHGGGVGSNWTFGCIALRNADIDELFAPGVVGRGTRVRITGTEVGR